LSHADVEGRFLVLMRVGNEPCDEIDQEIGDTTVTRMLDLRDILELIVDGLDVTVANSKTDLIPPQAAEHYPAIPEGEIQKGRRSRCRPVRRSPPLFE
jgi:hypothetical protein